MNHPWRADLRQTHKHSDTQTIHLPRRSARTSLAIAAILVNYAVPILGQTVSAPPAGTVQNVEPSGQSRGVIPQGGRPRVGIALEGGGALGLAHIGVMEWMVEHHVPVDAIAGTSMGALVGALIASGESPAEVATLAKSDVFKSMFTLKPPLAHLSYRRREDRTEMPGALTFGLKGGGVTLGSGLVGDNELNAFLTRELVPYDSSNLDYDDLPIPFRCVSTDLTTLQPKVFNSGPLHVAVRSSISIPGVFPPVHFNGDILVDGAIVDNLPIDVLRQQLHPDVVISVYLGDSSFSEADASSLTSVFGRALSAGTSRNVALARPLADIEIAPAVTALSVTDFAKADVLIKAGYAAAEVQRDKLLRYALNGADWNSYKSEVASRKRRPPVRVDSVHLDDPDGLQSKRLAARADKFQGKPFNEEKTEALVSDIRGEGAIDAFYSTFHAPQSSQSAPTHVASPAADNGVVIHLRPNRDGPPYLLLGTDIAASTANVTSIVFDARLVDENLGGHGSELRTDMLVGYLTRLGTEYYKPIASTAFFVQPHLQYLREPVYFWADQKRVSERLFQRTGGGLDLGWTANKDLQAALSYQASTIRWVLKDGADNSPTPHASGTTQTVAGHLVFSNRTAELASPAGSRVDLTAGYLLHTVDSNQAPFMDLKARQSFRLTSDDLLIVTANADTYFRHNVADPLRFTLGGPLRLSAASVDEFRGTDTVLAQALALHRIANLPTGLGQGIYLATGYEAGSVWSPEQRSFVRQDGLLGILLNTPLGAMTVGGAVGDAGHRKFFFTLGRLF